ncbi:MAG TPA: general secretion pathway protein GspB [Tepidisphaeraceae bacterium]
MSFDSTQEDSAESIPSVEVQPDEDNGEGFDSSFAGGGTKSGNRGLVILGGLILIGAVSVWFVYFRGGPQSAQAGMAPSDGGSQIKQFLDSGNINMMKQTLKETEKIVKQFRAYPGKTQVPLESLHTNPFRELEPKANEPTAANSRDAERAEELHKQAIAAVAELHLQSIVRGNKVRACMINNAMYREGQQIGILKIEQITPSAVVVSSGQYRFEIKMQN